eukprot:sb/3471044/
MTAYHATMTVNNQHSTHSTQGTFRIYPLPADGSEPPPRMLQNAPSNNPIELKVRVYIIRARGLEPQDPNGLVSCPPLPLVNMVTDFLVTPRLLNIYPYNETFSQSDPYPALKIGKTKIRDRDHYVPKCLEPMYGLMYELDCVIPLESELKVQIFDYDLLSGDDLIGETKIDLENRYLSARRGVCGLPKRYYM